MEVSSEIDPSQPLFSPTQASQPSEEGAPAAT